MYPDLVEHNSRPEPFSRYTTRTLWTDPWIAGRMLRNHLDPATDLASRTADSIDSIVDWIDRQIGLAGKTICDLGCGPGLYASRMAARGAKVTGIDFSVASLAHARADAAVRKLDIDYRQADYLADELPGGFDMVSLIYGDFCTLSPAQRHEILRRVRTMLNPGGNFVFDVFTTPQFEARREATSYARSPMDGFWSPDDHFAFHTVVLYDREKIALDRYLVVGKERRFEIFNWLQYFEPETISAEVRSAGFTITDCLDVHDGKPWSMARSELAVVARA